MGKYEIGDKFMWREECLFTEAYKNDIYELRYDEEDHIYYVATIYSDNEDDMPFIRNENGNLSYEEICMIIDEELKLIG